MAPTTSHQSTSKANKKTCDCCPHHSAVLCVTTKQSAQNAKGTREGEGRRKKGKKEEKKHKMSLVNRERRGFERWGRDGKIQRMGLGQARVQTPCSECDHDVSLNCTSKLKLKIKKIIIIIMEVVQYCNYVKKILRNTRLSSPFIYMSMKQSTSDQGPRCFGGWEMQPQRTASFS